MFFFNQSNILTYILHLLTACKLRLIVRMRKNFFLLDVEKKINSMHLMEMKSYIAAKTDIVDILVLSNTSYIKNKNIRIIFYLFNFY